MVVRDSKTILLKIKSFMVENEIKNKELAKKLNLSEAALSSRLKQDNISITSLVEICNALGCDLDIELIKKTIPNKYRLYPCGFLLFLFPSNTSTYPYGSVDSFLSTLYSFLCLLSQASSSVLNNRLSFNLITVLEDAN